MHKIIPIVIGCCIATIIAFIMYRYTKTENFVGNGSPMIILYHSPGCPHCVAFMPVWDEFAGKAIISTKKIDCTKESCPNIDGFPTVILRKSNGTSIQFDKKRTVDDLMTFVADNQ